MRQAGIFIVNNAIAVAMAVAYLCQNVSAITAATTIGVIQV